MNTQHQATDLDPVGEAWSVHSTRHVDRVAPDVILRLARTDHAGDDGSVVQTFICKKNTRIDLEQEHAVK